MAAVIELISHAFALSGRLPIALHALQNEDTTHTDVVLMMYRAEEKGGLREFHAARVNVVLKEIDEGLRMHKSCPSLLKSALAHEVVRGAYAIA